MTALKTHLCEYIHAIAGSYTGAWLVWCDPHGDWLSLLRAAAQAERGFRLLELPGETLGQLGGPAARRALQAQIDIGQSFVLVVPAASGELGWLWSQALLAERTYDRPLREQLREWGWRPQSLTISDEEVAALARRGLAQDPAEWSGGGLQPDLPLLLDVLAGGSVPAPEQRLVLEMTIEAAGLPALPAAAGESRGAGAQLGDPAALQQWRTAALARLLVTQACNAAPELISGEYELLIPSRQRPLALSLLERWIDSVRLRRGLPDAILAADRVADLGSLAAPAALSRGPFLSRVAEAAAFAGICARLSGLSGRDLLETLAACAPELARHADGFWGRDCLHPQAIAWGELLRLAVAVQQLLAATQDLTWGTPAAAIAWYTNGGWRLDRAGEELLRNLDRPTPDLLGLIGPLRAAYRARWEHSLLRWSELWTAAGCPTPALTTAGDWLAAALHESQRATAIMVADALRYDLAAGLAERVNDLEGAERAAVSPARAPLPTTTALGMPLALPIGEEALEADLVAGKWQVRRRGRSENLSLASARRDWWLTEGQVAPEALLTLGAALHDPLPVPAPGRGRLVIYDDAIDTLGHDDELAAQGSGVILDRYLAVITRLRDAGWRRILLTTDHGYIHWPAGQESSVPPPAPDPAYSSRRALAYPLTTTFPGPQSLAPGGHWRVALASGAACFRAYGGLGFFHGGASPQEWIIPCVTVQWPQEARPVNVQVEPLPQVLSQRPRVILNIRRNSLLVEDALPRQVEVIIREAQNRTILFRSVAVTVTPDREQASVSVSAVEGVSAPRGAMLRIEARDTSTEEILDTAASALAIELTGW